MVHDKSESAFVQAMARAKSPTHYIGMTSLSGKQRALFITPFASYEAWEKDNNAVMKNKTLNADLDRAFMDDGELLESEDTGIFSLREDLSLRPLSDIAHMRYLEISSYNIRPGHNGEWNEAVKMVKAAYEKAVPEAHWSMWELKWGGEGGTFLVLISRKSLAEADRGDQEDKLFAGALGAHGLKVLDELVAASIASSSHQIFAFNPHMSYVDESWIKADPEFWNPEPEAAPAPKSKKAKQ